MYASFILDIFWLHFGYIAWVSNTKAATRMLSGQKPLHSLEYQRVPVVWKYSKQSPVDKCRRKCGCPRKILIKYGCTRKIPGKCGCPRKILFKCGCPRKILVKHGFPRKILVKCGCPRKGLDLSCLFPGWPVAIPPFLPPANHPSFQGLDCL